jgi:integrase
MDISYVTAARISDILAIHLSNWTAEGLTIKQIKTGKLQIFRRSQALEAVIESARAIPRPVRGLYLLCTQRGKPYSYATINTWWQQAREKAGIEDVHFHDIRGKSATDAKRDGTDYQALLGHTTKAMSDRYIKIEEAQQVETLQRKI